MKGITCVHCGQVKPRKKMTRNEDSVNFPGQWICMDTVRCADARYDRDKKRGII